MTSLSVVFAGTPEFGIPSLEKIFNSEHSLKAVYTQPDRPAGRGRKMQASAVKQWALDNQIDIFQPLNFKDEATVAELKSLKPDVLVVIAYGLILPARVLNIPRLGCINVHASLLPHWRGASPVQHSLLHGDKETGVTIMKMDVGMDTGDVLMLSKCAIAKNDTTLSLQKKLAELAPQPLLDTLNNLKIGKAVACKQDNSKATYAGKIAKTDALINWHQPATTIDCQIRAYNPWPIAFTYLQDEVLRVHQAEIIPLSLPKTPGTILSFDKQGLVIATATDAIRIEKIQFAGGKVLTISECLQSNRAALFAGIIG